MRQDRSRLLWSVSAAVWMGGAGVAQAVIVDGANGTGTANTTSASFPVAGLNNVGTVVFNPPGSGVYLGNGWVLTAVHVGTVTTGTAFQVAGGGYFCDGTVVRLNDPSNNQPTNVEVFHLSSSPPLPTLNLASTTPSIASTIYTMGDGLRGSQVFYNVTGTGAATVFTPTPTATGSNAQGYQEDATTHVQRWGSNLTTTPPGASAGANKVVVTVQNFGNVTIFGSTFDSGNPTGSESQVSLGDSGGGVFNTSNVLVGMNDLEFTTQNQPANTALYGNQAGYADIATYRSQIVTIAGVPEPSTAGLLMLGAAAGLCRRRRPAAG